MPLKQIIQNIAHSAGYQVSKIRQPIEYPYIDVLALIVQDYIQKVPHPFFVQIGANDGETADPLADIIRKYHLRGILVEPQPNTFQRLKTNYQDQPQLIFENSLIAAQDGTETLYAIPETSSDQLPTWCYQIASLDQQTMLRLLREQEQQGNLPKNIQSLIQGISLPALTFPSLLKKHDIHQIDILVIDTMGYDFEIIKMIPFDIIKPAIINFEHSLLPPEQKQVCFKYLQDLGYGLIEVSVDTIAYLHAPIRPGIYRFS